MLSPSPGHVPVQIHTHDVLAAYRADIAAAGSNASTYAGADREWLAVGTVLQRALGLSPSVRRDYLSSAFAEFEADDQDDRPDRGPTQAVCRVAVRTAEHAERHSAFCTAIVILELAELLIEPSETRSRGRLIAHRARVLRKVGQLDESLVLYDRVATLGDANADSELLARAAIGRAAVARERGNYPESREQNKLALSIPATSSELVALHGLAHQGLQIAAAMAGDLDAALRHGRLAFLAAPEGSERRTDVLVNMASVCHMAGKYRAALNGHLSTAVLTKIDGVRMTALGGAAVAGACLSDRATVDRVVAAGRPLMTAHGHAHACADMERAFAEAYFRLGDTTRAEPFRVDALRRARAGGFYEVELEVEALASLISNVEPLTEPDLSAEADDAVQELSSADTDQLVAAITGDRRA